MASINDHFEAFWKTFPKGRKTAKADARRKFTAICTGKHKDLKATPEVLIHGAMRYAMAMGDGHPYVKMPSTWLNQGCWEDEDLAPPSPDNLPGLPQQRQATANQSSRNRSLRDELTDTSWAKPTANSAAFDKF